MLCYIVCVIYQKCALNIAHHAYFTRKTVRPRRLMVSPTTPTQPQFFFHALRISGEWPPLHCSLQGKHVDRVASQRGGSKVFGTFIQTIYEMP